jgi:plasmid stability protein
VFCRFGCNTFVDSIAAIAYSGAVPEQPMATLTIRNIDPAIKERLRVRAAEHGRSMEAELRVILIETVGTAPSPQVNLAEAIRRRFAPFGGVDDLKLHPGVPAPEPPLFDE